MKTQSIQKPVARERGESGRNPTLVAPSASKLTDMSAMATAAGALALGVLQARDGQAATPTDPYLANKPSVPVEEPTSEPGRVPFGDGAVALERAPETDQHDVPGIPNAAAQEAHPQQIGATESNTETNAADTVISKSVAVDHMKASTTVSASPIHDDLVARLADQITSSADSVLAAAEQGGTDGLGKTIANDIFETASSIVEDIRGQLQVSQLAGITKTTVATAVDAVEEAIPLADIAHTVDSMVAQSGVLDLLNGTTGFDIPETAVAGVIGDLTGVTSAAASVDVPQPIAAALDIPASLLGGAEPGKGMLAQLFYDDGGGAELPGAAVAAASEPAGLGFLGQPLAAAEELTGVFHGSNALHLV